MKNQDDPDETIPFVLPRSWRILIDTFCKQTHDSRSSWLRNALAPKLVDEAKKILVTMHDPIYQTYLESIGIKPTLENKK